MPVDFSVVIPVFNEEENIPELYRRLTAQMEKLGAYEIILVDDGSSDASWQFIKELYKGDSRVKGLSFSRNFGHHIALSAGLDYAKGSTIILMDADMQDPPDEVPRLIEKFRENYDIVYGIRKTRHDSIFKRMTSALFWVTLKRFSGVPLFT